MIIECKKVEEKNFKKAFTELRAVMRNHLWSVFGGKWGKKK